MAQSRSFGKVEREPVFKGNSDPGKIELHANVQRNTAQGWIKFRLVAKTVKHWSEFAFYWRVTLFSLGERLCQP